MLMRTSETQIAEKIKTSSLGEKKGVLIKKRRCTREHQEKFSIIHYLNFDFRHIFWLWSNARRIAEQERKIERAHKDLKTETEKSARNQASSDAAQNSQLEDIKGKYDR